MGSSSSMSLYILSACCLLLQTSARFSFAKTPKTEAEDLIRGLNLFPKHDINIVANRSSETLPRIVEKRFQFDQLVGDSGTSVQDLGHHAGYIRLPHTKDARMFYFFFKSRKNKTEHKRKNKTDPVIIWLTGGPGCGSEMAVFFENGPFQIKDNLSLVWNDFGWDKVSNIIFVDQPTGSGFSYSSDPNNIRHDEVGVSNDLYDFLQAFFQKHTEYIKNDFYITGESYAGHYIPALASRIHQGNKNKEGIHINLKGFAIGNGLTNPEIQFKAYPDYALEMKLLNQSDYNNMSQLVSQCEQATKLCGTGTGANSSSTCTKAYNICITIVETIVMMNKGINRYDIRKQCVGSKLCYDISPLERFLAQKSVREAIGVADIEFVACSTTVFDNMISDWMRNLEVGIPALLEDGIKLLVYAGEYDFMCNWLGNSRWVDAMEWSGQKGFLAAPTVPFTVDGAEAGVQKSQGPLKFLKMHNAGHLVTMDQPNASLQMIHRWIQGYL